MLLFFYQIEVEFWMFMNDCVLQESIYCCSFGFCFRLFQSKMDGEKSRELSKAKYVNHPINFID